MRRPRLVYVVTHPVTADLLLRGQLSFMRRQGFDVTVVAAPGELLDKVAAREGVEAVGIPMERSTELGGDLVAVARLTQLFRRIRPDIVNAGTTKGGLLGMMGARAASVPIRIYLLRGLRLETVTGPMRAILGVTERIASACAQDVACVSQSLLRISTDGGWIPRRKAIVVGEGSSNGVDTGRFARTVELRAEGARRAAAFGIGPEERVVGFVGRLVADKGVRELLDAFSIVRQTTPDAKLLLVGSDLGDQAIDPELARAVREAPGVVPTGHIADVAPFYARMDVLAFPSFREGFPNTLLEAACASLPIVGFRSTGIVDAVIDGETGTIVDQRDSVALGRGIAAYLHSAELSAAHGGAARARAERVFSRDAVWGAWLAHYRVRLGERGLPLPMP